MSASPTRPRTALVKKGKANKKAVPSNQHELTSWADAPENEVHAAVINHAQHLLETNQAQHVNNLKWRMYYSDRNTSVFAGSTQSNSWMSMQGTITHNLVASCVRSVDSQVFKDPPRVRITTENGNGKMHRQAKKLTQFMDGILDEGGLRLEAPRAGKDALICGLGYGYVYNDLEGNPCVERVWVNDVLVDLGDSDMLHPSQMFLRSKASRKGLIEQYPDFEEEIAKAAPAISFNSSARTASWVPNVGLIEAWELPSPGKEDGRHVICCSTCTLVDEPWELDFFPIVPIRWDEVQLSWFGAGIAEQLEGTQNYTNEMLNVWSDSMRMLTMARLWTNDPNLSEGQMSQSGIILHGSPGSSPPQSLNYEIAPPDYIQFLNAQHEWAYQLIGLNEGTVDATKPADLGSGTALREYRDNQSQRLSNFKKAWDTFHTDIARAAIELTRRWTKKNGKFKAQVRGKQFLGTISWDDCSIDKNAYSVGVFATSDLPRTPAGRIQEMNELTQNGSIDRERAMLLLRDPDIDGAIDQVTADLQLLDMIIDKILDDEEYTSPDEHLMMNNPQMILTIVNNEICKARTDKETDAAIEMLVRFFGDCLDKLKLANDLKAQAQPPPPPALARPEPLPTSPLVPQA